MNKDKWVLTKGKDAEHLGKEELDTHRWIRRQRRGGAG